MILEKILEATKTLQSAMALDAFGKSLRETQQFGLQMKPKLAISSGRLRIEVSPEFMQKFCDAISAVIEAKVNELAADAQAELAAQSHTMPTPAGGPSSPP